MALTVPVVKKFNTTGKVKAVSSGVNLVFGQYNGRLVIGDGEIEIAPITSVGEFSNGEILVGCEDGLHCFNGLEESWGVPYETGIESVFVGKSEAIVIDGLGKGYLYNSKGNLLANIAEQSILFVSMGKNIAIANEAGFVSTYSLEGVKLWERPARGEVGERITAIGWDDSVLIVAREGHGLVPGDEEALEIEYWNGSNLEKRIDTRSRVVSIDGPWMGLDMGGVMLNGEVVAELSHPAHTLISTDESVLVGSWFHLHSINSQGIQWSVETQGMVEHVSANTDFTAVLIAGEDQNDYTESEPVVLIDARAEPVENIDDDSSIDDWGDAPVIEIDAEELYGEEMSIEEIAGIGQSSPVTGHDDLLSALEDDFEPEEIEESIEDDLMLALSLDAEEIIAPSPDAGGDQQVKTEDDGTATVTLDGSGTTDPQDRIELWSWVDDTGREIGTNDKIRVKLREGSHRFELRIRDKDGRWSSDSIDIRVD